MQGIRGKQIIQVFLVVLLSIFTLLLTVSEVYAVRRLGCVKAVCMDGCKNFGNESNCNSTKTCKYGNMNDPSPDTDGYTCNNIYLATTSTMSIKYCSPSPVGTLQLCVDAWSEQRYCENVVYCMCFQGPIHDYCNSVRPTTTPLDSDDCE